MDIFIDDIKIVEIPKIIHHCQFCGAEETRKYKQKVVTCRDCKQKRDKINTLKRYHLKNPNAKYKHD